MFVDASAVFGILAREIDAPVLAPNGSAKPNGSSTSPVAIYEAVPLLFKGDDFAQMDVCRRISTAFSEGRATTAG